MLTGIVMTLTALSQYHSQIRFKLGLASVNLPAVDSKGYAYRMFYPGLNLGGSFGLEYARYPNKSSVAWFSGISIDPQSVMISMNRENFQGIFSDPSVEPTESTFRFYFGLEKRLNKKPRKNQFGVFGGLGLAVNFESHASGRLRFETSEGVTKNGEQVKSTYKVWNLPPGSGYYMSVYIEREFRVTPTVFTGLRLQRITRKKKQGLSLELMANYGLTNYFTYQVPYTLNGLPQTDRFDEKGFIAQLNLMIPIVNFGKVRETERPKVRK